MNQFENDRFLRALGCKTVDRTPIWIMRQAGRYLPEYRQSRKKTRDFMTFCKTPELACEVTMQPLERFHLDAAILFSDILTIADALPLDLQFKEGEGPVIGKPLRTEEAINQLPDIQVEEELSYVSEAIRLIQKNLHAKIPLIGFAGSPWTQAVYMVEGGSSKTFSIIKGLMYANPRALKVLLEQLVRLTTQYVIMQIEAGVNALMLFDTWGGVLSPHTYQVFSLEPMQQIITAVKQKYPMIPIIMFTKGGGLWLEKMSQSGCQALGLDWTISISDALKLIPADVAIQGNLDPCVLYGTKDTITSEAQKILKAVGRRPGFVFNLGHGIYPDIDPEKVAHLVEVVHQWSSD